MTPSSYLLTSTLTSLGVSTSSHDSLPPKSRLLSRVCRGQTKVMWCPVCGVSLSHGQLGSSDLPMWWSQARCGLFSVRIHVYALSAWRPNWLPCLGNREHWSAGIRKEELKELSWNMQKWIHSHAECECKWERTRAISGEHGMRFHRNPLPGSG